ncbi:MAG: T9SS type A sorting domain-containing protein [Candidatus Edwardsbacteria bacterium]|jgi:hypothetical protein|nr:T9SS type A sorting domain-containing protein [Candidatus Edwardsbacteria bacterium]
MRNLVRGVSLLIAVALTAAGAGAGVLVLPANEITFNPALDTLNPSSSGYWWNPENVFVDDSSFAVDTVIQFRYDSLGVGFADPGPHPTWVITNVSLSAKHRAHYWKARARLIPYVDMVPLIDEADTLLDWPPFKFGSTEMINTVEITQLDTALADSTWDWDDIAGLSLKYEPRTSNTVYYINHLYATVTYVDTATADTGHCFEFEPIGDPQLLGVPFPVVIRARDLLGNLLTSYGDSVSISDLTGTISPTIGWFSGGVCSLAVTISGESAGTAITVSDGDTSGVSNTFAVVNPGLHHFEFGDIGSPQMQGVAFPASVVACDYFGDTIDAFNEPVDIWDLTGSVDTTVAFAGGMYTGDVSVDSVVAWDVLTCGYTAGAFYTGSSAGFEVVPYSGVAGGQVPAAAPRTFSARLRPNPVRDRATIELQLPGAGIVAATVYNILGQPVQRVDFGRRTAGWYGLPWQIDAGLPAGIYLLTVDVDGARMATRKLLVVR